MENYKFSDNFNWNTYINDKAIVEFEKENGLESNRPGMNGYYLLSYFIDLYTSPKKGKNIIYTYINDDKYIYVSTSFILKNLRLLKLENRSLIRIINVLEENGYINKSIRNGSQRFIKISDGLLKHCKPNSNKKGKSDLVESLAIKVGKRFAKTSKNQLTDVFHFLNNLQDLKYFETQFESYVKFKDYSNEIVHRFEKYCDLWDSHEWDLLLKQHKHLESQEQINNLF